VLFSLAAPTVGCGTRLINAPPTGQFPVAEKITVAGISDFGKVNDFLYRGAQPKDGGLEQLKRFGIDTVVDLRGERHGLIEMTSKSIKALRLLASGTRNT
jgi:hypothetical protein